MITRKSLSLLLGFLLLGSCHYGPSKKTDNHNETRSVKTATYDYITKDELKRLMKVDPTLYIIDIRTPGEWKGKYKPIPGSNKIEMKAIQSNWNLIPAKKTIVWVCRSGRRAKIMAKEAAERGIHTRVLRDGLKEFYKLRSKTKEKEERHDADEDFGC